MQHPLNNLLSNSLPTLPSVPKFEVDERFMEVDLANIPPPIVDLTKTLRKEAEEKTTKLGMQFDLSPVERQIVNRNKENPWAHHSYKSMEGQDLRGVDVDRNQVYQDLNSGESVSRFESFTPYMDNADRLARQQGTGEKWFNGVKKFGAKTAVNVLGGTVGVVGGIGSALREGTLDALYDNNLARTLDDWSTELDIDLPNHKTQEERNMGFLESMGTANFWANDFLGGLSFLTGMIGSEAIWAAATGGASLATGAARASVKAGGKELAQEAIEQGVKAYSKTPAKLLKAYQRSIPTSRTGMALNNARFLITSAGYESSMEARNSLDESLESFITSYEKVHGRKPTETEYAEFMQDAVSNANKVFGANMALVGASNIVQFGAMFGAFKFMDNAGSKVFNRAFGNTISKSVDDAGKVIYEANKAGRLRRWSGSTLSFMKAPITEGFVEEGGQSVISGTSQKWLASRYNPDAMQDNLSMIDAAMESAKHTYGTKEGFKEVGLGMLIGIFGERMGRVRNQGLGGVYGTDFGDAAAQNEILAGELTEHTARLNSSQRRMLDRLTKTNQFQTYLTESKKSADKGDFTQASMEFDTAQFTKMLIEQDADMLDESIKDFDYMLENMKDKQVMEETGLNENQLADYKTALAENYKKNVEDFKQATKIAAELNPFNGRQSKEFKEALGDTTAKSYQNQHALNIYLGMKAKARSEQLAKSLDDFMGEGGIGDAMRLYNNLDAEGQIKAERIREVESEINQVDKEFQELMLEFDTTSPSQSERTEANQAVNQAADKKELKRQNLIRKKQKLEDEYQTLKTSVSTKFNKSRFAFGGVFSQTEGDLITPQQIEDSIKRLEELDDYRKLIRKESPQAAEQLDNLINEYKRNLDAFTEFNRVFEQMQDVRFAKNQYKGLTKIFQGIGSNIKLSDAEKATMDAVKKANPTLSQEEIFTLSVLQKMTRAYKDNVQVDAFNPTAETITTPVYDEFVRTGLIPQDVRDNIVEKKINGTPLTFREEQIYAEIHKDVTAEIMRKKETEGDSLSSLVVKPPVTKFDPQEVLGQLRNKVATILQNKRQLQKFDVENLNKDQIVTEKDRQRYSELYRDNEDGRLTPETQAEFNELREKINDWGRLEGTLTNEGETLSDLFEQIILIENQVIKPESVTVGAVNESEILEIPEFKSSVRVRQPANSQTYDKAFVIKDKDGNYNISNINVSGILQHIGNKLSFSLFKNGKPVKGDGSFSIKTTKVGDEFVLQYRDLSSSDPDMVHRMILRISAGNNVQVSEETRQKLHKLTNLRLYPEGTVPSNYHTLLTLTVKGGQNFLEPVSTNFQVEFGEEMGMDAVWNLKKGSKVFFEVSPTFEFNRDLFRRYDRATGQEKEALRKEIEMSMNIFIKDGNNNLVGVLKSTQDTVIVKEESAYTALQLIRKLAARRVLEEDYRGKEAIDLDISVRVDNILPGRPNLTIRQDGNRFVVESKEISPENMEHVADVGFVEDGMVHTKKPSTKYEAHPFLTKILKSDRYKGKRVPIIILKHRGRNYAYPVSIKPSEDDTSSLLDDVMATDYTPAVKVKKLNEILVASGVNANQHGFTADNLSQARIDKAKDLMQKSLAYKDVKEWLDPNVKMQTILENEVLVNIDLSNPFHSPKVQMDFKLTDENLGEGFEQEIEVVDVVKEIIPDTVEVTETVIEGTPTVVVSKKPEPPEAVTPVVKPEPTVKEKAENPKRMFAKEGHVIELTYKGRPGKYYATSYEVGQTNQVYNGYDGMYSPISRKPTTIRDVELTETNLNQNILNKLDPKNAKPVTKKGGIVRFRDLIGKKRNEPC